MEQAKPIILTDEVDKDAVQTRVISDHYANEFVRLGRELLEKSEKTNIVTLAQFEPFIPLFNSDRERLKTDRAYAIHINELYKRYIRELEINLYEPTIVVVSETDNTEVAWLDRAFTRVASDNVTESSRRETLAISATKSPMVTKDEMLLEASMSDLLDANETKAQKDSFFSAKTISAIINSHFYRNNLSETEKAKIQESVETSTDGKSVTQDESIDFEIDDD